jgi:hypothetical protein
MTQTLPNEWFVSDERTNAAAAWTVTAALVVVAVAGLTNGRLDVVILAGAAAFVAVVPPVTSGSWTQTMPWPLLLLASFPLAFMASGLFVGTFLGGVGVSALALLVVVALQLTTTVAMTPRFALWFVFIATLATAGFWAVASAASARLFGSAFVSTNDELMVVFTSATLAGLAAGGLFRWYFRRTLERNADVRTGEGGLA